MLSDRVNETINVLIGIGKSQSYRGHRKSFNLYVKFIVHSSYAKTIIVQKMVDRQTYAPGYNKRHLPKLWLMAKKRETKTAIIWK